MFVGERNLREASPRFFTLHVAARKGNVALVRYLISLGVEVEEEDDVGFKGLQLAHIHIIRGRACGW